MKRPLPYVDYTQKLFDVGTTSSEERTLTQDAVVYARKNNVSVDSDHLISIYDPSGNQVLNLGLLPASTPFFVKAGYKVKIIGTTQYATFMFAHPIVCE